MEDRWEDIIKMDLKETECEVLGLDSFYSELIPVADYCEQGNETSGSIKDGEYPSQLSNYQPFKKSTSILWNQQMKVKYMYVTGCRA
jgi:hypothetical protein